jgi:CrcB protein
MQLFQQYLVVGLGGALGSMLRFGIGTFIDSSVTKSGQIFPWGTIFANITGCFVIGLVATVSAPGTGRYMISPLLLRFITIGMLGGYTTFSSFTLQTLNLWNANQRGGAAVNVLISVVLCLLGVWLGAAVADSINKLR